MNPHEVPEVRVEIYMKSFLKHCQRIAKEQQIPSSIQDNFLQSCVERLISIANRAEKMGISSILQDP